ncbi:MAG: spermidine/putrescine ABC transporter substrate-binding protein [Actinomycetota bacterium]|nr:spermidine/putrescine ABC transporter substrate-binding protein [Actinomycetota bacterium]
MSGTRHSGSIHKLAHAEKSRRDVLRGAGAIGLLGLLTACGTRGLASANPSAALDRSAQERFMTWGNWSAYLDTADDGVGHPTLDAFIKKSGIDVQYREDIEDMQTFIGKIQGQMSLGKDVGYDIVVLTDWMASRMIRFGFVQDLDLARIPNMANLLPALKKVDFDPGRTKSLTWQTGFAGLAWNTDRIRGGIQSVEDLWKPELKGRISVVSEFRDTIGVLMLAQGVDPSSDSWGDDEFDTAIDTLQKHVSSGQIRQIQGNSYTQALASGDALAVIGWAGDVMQLNFEAEGEAYGFALPDSGGMLFSDNLMVPIGSPHKANAEKLFDYYYEPAVAAQVAAYVNYVCPVVGAREEMAKIDESLVDNELIFPSDKTLGNTRVFRTLTKTEEQRYQQKFNAVMGT